MGRVALRRVTAYNFRSFFGKHEILFDDRGLYLVRGSNLDSRGESGAGKSSLLLAIAYALNFSPYSLAELTNWESDEGTMWVEIELDTEIGPVVVHRGDKLWLKVGKPKPLTSAKSVEEKLEEILKIPAKLREALTYRRQRKPGMFLSKNDGEKKAFLVELLGLQWLEKEIAAQVKVVTAAEKAVEAIVPAMEKAHEDLVFAEKNTAPVEIIDVRPIDELVEECRAEAGLIRLKLQSLSDLRKRALEKEEPREEVDKLKALFTQCVKREANAQRLEMLGRATWLGLLQTYQAEQDSLLDLEHQGVALYSRIQTLKEKKCSECKRPWENADSTQLEAQYEALASKFASIRAAKPPGQYVSNGNLDKLRSMRLDLEQRIADEESRIEQAREKRVERYTVQAEVLVQRLEEKNREMTDAENKAAVARATNRANLIRHEGEQKFIARARAIQNQELTKHHNAKHVLTAELDYLEMLRSFMAKYFADILTQISDEANKIIGNLPNTAHVTLHFDVERETQDGKMRNEITPIIYFGDKKWSLEAGASGGMYTSVELAVDLAVGRIIADRTGCDIGWLILDESFNGHDKITKESCLQILQQYASDKLIIIVDHASEFKEFFSKVIEVQIDKGRSAIV